MTDPQEHPVGATVIFVESIRWLGIRWGLGPLRRGLRRAGIDADVLYWRWHATWRGCLVLPALMDQAMLQREAQRLANFIATTCRENPGRPIRLMGYSCGAFVALRALELLPQGVQVDVAVFFAGAFDPDHDLTAALAHVRGKVVVCSSPLDFLVLGAGTALFGTGERTFGLSAGMVGLWHPSARHERVVQVCWEPGMMRLGYFGDHFTAVASRFFAERVAPLIV
jgi:hypothetical protein